MKTFFGGTCISKEQLVKNNIYHPIRLEYYKTEQVEDYKTIYGIEVVKTEYKEGNVNVENKVIDRITYEENTINKILQQFKLGEITPVVSEEMVRELL